MIRGLQNDENACVNRITIAVATTILIFNPIINTCTTTTFESFIGNYIFFFHVIVFNIFQISTPWPVA